MVKPQVQFVVRDQHGSYRPVGVIETGCWPARWYAGYLSGNNVTGYYPARNDTCFWHRELRDAEDALIKLVESADTGGC